MSHITLSEYDACPLNASGRNVAAVPLGRLNGRRVYRVPVYIRMNSSRACATVATRWITVTAYNATDAANWVRDNTGRPETEIMAIGPRGGVVHRFVGWHSAIGAALFGRGAIPNQLQLI